MHLIRELSVLVREGKSEEATLLATKLYISHFTHKVRESRFARHLVIACAEERLLASPEIFVAALELALRVQEEIRRDTPSRKTLLDLEELVGAACAVAPSREFPHRFACDTSLRFLRHIPNPGAQHPPVVHRAAELCRMWVASLPSSKHAYFAVAVALLQEGVADRPAAPALLTRRLADHDAHASELLQLACQPLPEVARVARAQRLRRAELTVGPGPLTTRYLQTKGVASLKRKRYK